MDPSFGEVVQGVGVLALIGGLAWPVVGTRRGPLLRRAFRQCVATLGLTCDGPRATGEVDGVPAALELTGGIHSDEPRPAYLILADELWSMGFWREPRIWIGALYVAALFILAPDASWLTTVAILAQLLILHFAPVFTESQTRVRLSLGYQTSPLAARARRPVERPGSGAVVTGDAAFDREVHVTGVLEFPLAALGAEVRSLLRAHVRAGGVVGERVIVEVPAYGGVHPDVRRTATALARALDAAAVTSVQEGLAARAMDDPVPDVRLRALDALVRDWNAASSDQAIARELLGDEDDLASRLDDPDERVVLLAARRLVLTRDFRSLPRLAAASGRVGPITRRHVVEAMTALRTLAATDMDGRLSLAGGGPDAGRVSVAIDARAGLSTPES